MDGGALCANGWLTHACALACLQVPTSHVMRALGTDQFYCAGPNCPTIQVVTQAGTQTVTRYAYVSRYLGSTYGKRWGELGWVALAAGVMAVLALFSLRFINHQKR